MPLKLSQVYNYELAGGFNNVYLVEAIRFFSASNCQFLDRWSISVDWKYLELERKMNDLLSDVQLFEHRPLIHSVYDIVDTVNNKGAWDRDISTAIPSHSYEFELTDALAALYALMRHMETLTAIDSEISKVLKDGFSNIFYLKGTNLLLSAMIGPNYTSFSISIHIRNTVRWRQGARVFVNRGNEE